MIRAAVIGVAALALSGCISSGLREMSPAGRDANLETLKEVNRHIELCDRFYAWPFVLSVKCDSSRPTSAVLSPEQIAAMIAQAVKAAVDQYTSPTEDQ